MKEATALSSLMDKYRFTQAIPEEVQKRVAASKRKSLALTLKRLNQQTLPFSLITALYLWFTSKGLKISLGGAKILTTAGALTLAASLSTVATMTVQYFQGQSLSAPAESQGLIAVKPIDTTENDTDNGTKTGTADQYIMAIQPLKVNLTGKDMGNALTLALYRELKDLLGDEQITVLKTDGAPRCRYFLTGSVSGLGERLIITVRLFDGHSGKILFTDMYTCPGSEPHEACTEDYATELARKMRPMIEKQE
ncbi:MAG: hypothetical protein CVV44_12290 [Spirochaetae bacterium HGW-Spirochaetae-1]|jgi:hypothetical protein|nr:MAG: hypothetical protein CVV44_12290 [Spirochaetae bacterium HGW-Spirochaetae-1]